MAARRPLAQRRRTVGFSQEALAEQLRVDRSTIARWEAGETEPLPWLRPKLARVLQVSIEELERLLAVPDRDTGDAEERLRHVLEHPGRVDLVTAAQLRERVHRLDERYDKAPSASLLAEAGRCHGEVSFLRCHAARSRVQRELLAVECEAATLMGQLVWDASQRRDHLAARAYFDAAVDVARRLSDRTTEALALLRTSFVALYGEDDPSGGLTLATIAAAAATGTSQVLTGLALLHVAEAHAMLGQRADCERSLDEAAMCFAQIDATDPAIDLFSTSHHGRLAGSCYLFLNDAKRAQPILEETADTLRSRTKSRAIVLGNLALACIRQKNRDQAVSALHSAIDVIETTRGGGGLNVVFGAVREMRHWRGSSEVQSVYDRLFALLAAT